VTSGLESLPATTSTEVMNAIQIPCNAAHLPLPYTTTTSANPTSKTKPVLLPLKWLLLLETHRAIPLSILTLLAQCKAMLRHRKRFLVCYHSRRELSVLRQCIYSMIIGLKAIIKAAGTGMLVTRSADGELHSRAMTPASRKILLPWLVFK